MGSGNSTSSDHSVPFSTDSKMLPLPSLLSRYTSMRWPSGESAIALLFLPGALTLGPSSLGSPHFFFLGSTVTS